MFRCSSGNRFIARSRASITASSSPWCVVDPPESTVTSSFRFHFMCSATATCSSAIADTVPVAVILASASCPESASSRVTLMDTRMDNVLLMAGCKVNRPAGFGQTCPPRLPLAPPAHWEEKCEGTVLGLDDKDRGYGWNTQEKRPEFVVYFPLKFLFFRCVVAGIY